MALDKNVLEVLIAQGMTTRQIAEECGCSQHKVTYWMEVHNIPARYPARGGRLRRDRTTACAYCGVVIPDIKRRRQFCDQVCQNRFQYESYIERWLNGEETGVSGEGGLSTHIRRWLHEKHGSACEQCGWTRVHPVTGKVPLTIHHVDGQWDNNRPENLSLLCPNCHSLTETYGSLNAGRGRSQRLEKIREKRRTD